MLTDIVGDLSPSALGVALSPVPIIAVVLMLVVAAEVLTTGGDPVDRDESMMLRLGGSTSDVPLYG